MKSYHDFILVADLDGTLANSEHTVSQKNKEAIEYFVAQGGHFAVATGRTQKNAVPYLTGVVINAPCILYNGGALFSWQEQRFFKIKHMESTYLADFLRHCIAIFPNMCIEVFTVEQLYVVTDPANVDEHMQREQQEFVYAKLDDILEKLWIKIILCDSHERLLVGQNLLLEFDVENKTNNFFSAVTYLEIVGKDVSKGSMLSELLNMQQYRAKTVIATGDFHNDIDMLRLADCGVAPVNAQDDVKKVADVISVSNDDDLMHEIIYRIVPTLF